MWGLLCVASDTPFVATGYPAHAPTNVTLSMVQQLPPFASKLNLLGQKRAQVEFVDATWEVVVEIQVQKQPPPLSVCHFLVFSLCPVPRPRRGES